MLQVSFRRGIPEHLGTDHPELSLLQFLKAGGVVAAAQAVAAEEQARKSGQDMLSVLFQLQLIPPGDAHRLLRDHALFLLDRAVSTWRGKFSFEADAPPPPGSFPLGQRWQLLAESVRRLDPVALRARLGKRLLRHVTRSGGASIGRVDELALNAQEARLYASLDGTRTGEELLAQTDASMGVRLLYLLTELGHLSFAELVDETPLPPPAAAAPPPEASPPLDPATLFQGAPPAPRPQATTPRELPKVVRPGASDKGRRPGTFQKPAPPVMSVTARPAAEAPPPPQGPTLATGPVGETPEAQLKRLSGLFVRLQKADHFAALGLDRKATTTAEAKRAFFALAKELHPDTVTDATQTELRDLKESLFARINEAAQVLSDDARRKAYEQELDGNAQTVDLGRIFAAEESFQRAEIMIKARKYQDGLALLEEAIRLNADEAEFYAWRGYARFLISQDRKEAYPDSAADCRKAIRMMDPCVPAHLFLGHMSKVVGDAKLAQACYERVLQLEPRHVEALRELRLMGKR